MANLTGLSVGTYTVVITDDNSCLDTFDIEVASVVGLNEIDDLLDLGIYPNPADNNVSISFSSNAEQYVDITLIDLTRKRSFFFDQSEGKWK